MKTMVTLVVLVALVAVFGASLGAVTHSQAKETAQATVAQPAINLNSAPAADLQKLPGVGPAMAARIIEYREKNGGFKKVEDLMNVKGIGEKTFLKLKPLVTVTPPKTGDR